jgi:hypothetical protein
MVSHCEVLILGQVGVRIGVSHFSTVCVQSTLARLLNPALHMQRLIAVDELVPNGVARSAPRGRA